MADDETTDDIDWDEESAAIGTGSTEDPIYRDIGNVFGMTRAGTPLHIATERGDMEGVTLSLVDPETGRPAELAVADAIALGKRLLGAAIYWVDMRGVGDREAVKDAVASVASALEMQWRPGSPGE